MEEVRSHIANVDLIKSKDMLKLTLGFKATLPIDKVYALLGLVDEHYTPLFHPRFGVSDLNEVNRVIDPRTGFKDACDTLALIGELLETAKGRSNSRRARAILASGPMTAAQYTLLLTRDLEKIVKNLVQVQDGLTELEEERMQPDYSEKSTAHLVYTHVARDLVKQGDTLSFIRHAGIAYPRHEELVDLLSWVPD